MYFSFRNVISVSLERSAGRNEIEEPLNFLVAVPYSGHSLTNVFPDDRASFSSWAVPGDFVSCMGSPGGCGAAGTPRRAVLAQRRLRAVCVAALPQENVRANYKENNWKMKGCI